MDFSTTHELYTFQSILIRWHTHSLYSHRWVCSRSSFWLTGPFHLTMEKKNNPHYFWIRKDLQKELSPQNSFDVFIFFKLSFVSWWQMEERFVWMRTYSSAKLISSLRVIMEQCFPVTVDGITFSRVTKAGLFASVYITIWYYSKSWLQFTFAVFSMHEIRF